MSQQFTSKQRGILRERFVPQENTVEFATASQGVKADTALQPGQAATVAQGAKADSAIQPGQAATPDQGAKADTALQPGQAATLDQGAKADTAVQPSRSISAGTGLTGGGDLSANRTLSLNAASIASLALADTALQTAPVLKLSYQTGITTSSITIPATPASGSKIILFKNNLMLREGASDDFTISGASITLAVAAVAGDKFDIYYMA